MQTDFRSTVRQGIQYSKMWPQQPELAGLLPENRLIRLTALLQQVMPAAAVLCFCVQLQFGGLSQFGVAFSWSLFLLSLPIQAWYWLGYRARTPLPPALQRWYQQIRFQLQEAGVTAPALTAHKPLFFDLAALLESAYRQLDKAFVRQLI